MENGHETVTAFDPSSVRRPDPALLTYYLVIAAFTVIGFPFVFIPLYLKYRTLAYRFDEEGVSMSYGMFFRREVYLTYRRIQDIHVTRNLVHRWLGLADVAVQTASGAAGAEMTIEGLRDPQALRDYLYLRMRGAREEEAPAAEATAAPGGAAPPKVEDEALSLLREIRDAARALAAARRGEAP